MNAEDMAKALVATGGTGATGAIVANLSGATGITVTAIGAPALAVGIGTAAAIAAASYGVYVGYDAIRNKLGSTK